MISTDLPITTLLKKRFDSTCLHWLCCIFLILYIWMNQYSYAKSDKLFIVDHDLQFSSSLFEQYNKNPAGYINSLLKDLIFQKPCHPPGATFLDLRLAIEFYIFGRTLFVYKMDMAYFLIIMCLAIYFIVYTLTKREIFGLISSLVLLNFPVIMDISRKQFAFIPATAICTVALLFVIRDIRLDKKLNCVLFLICLLLGSLIHPSFLLYLAFIYLYLACSKKNMLYYVIMTVSFFLVFTWTYFHFIDWMENKYGHDGLPSSFFGLLVFSISKIGSEQYNIFKYSSNSRLLHMFIVNVFLLIYLYGLNKPICKSDISRIGPRQKLIFLFLGYVIILFLVTNNFIACFPMLFVLYIISFFVLLSLIENALPSLHILSQLYVILCSLFIFYQLVYTYKDTYFHPKPLQPISITAGKWLLGADEINDRLQISQDMTDMNHIFTILANENKRKTGTANLHILSSSVILYYNGEKINIGRSYPFYAFEGDFDDARWLYAPQAFYSGVQVQWKYLIMHLSPDDFGIHPLGTFANDSATARAKKGYASQMEEDISEYKYMFLTILSQSNDPAQIWQMPPIQAVLDQIKETNSSMYNKFFSNITLITKCRLHRNFFLFIFRINAPPSSIMKCNTYGNNVS